LSADRTVSDYLRDILEYAALARELVEGIDFPEFERDRRTHLAVIRSIEVIGEAARSVPEAVRNAYPEIPWTSVVGARNILLHAYFGVNLRVLWDSVHDDLPQLLETVERMLKDLERE
jgi:uncharacterized protein with HEPN domain